MQSTDNIYNFSVKLTDEQKESILKAAGKLPNRFSKAEFFEDLETIARDFVIYKSRNKQPTPNDIRREIQVINSAVKKINKVYGTSQNIHEINNCIVWGINKIISKSDPEGRNPGIVKSEIRRNLIMLEKASGSALEKIKKDKKKKGSDELTISLIYQLCVIWRDYFGKIPRTSVSGLGRAGGPFIRFIKAYFDVVLESISPEFESNYPEISAQFKMSKEAIRGRIRQLDIFKI